MQLQQNTWKDRLFITLIVMMLAGLFVSRALLSVSSILLLLVFIVQAKERQDWKRILLGASLIILPVLISGLWSNNLAEWSRTLEVKLPLITIGLAIATARICLRAWRWITATLLILTTLGTFWSTWQYLQHTNEILQNYLKAKVMPTPLNDDHIRFSWLIVLVIILSLKLIKGDTIKLVRYSAFVMCAWLVIYLHLLAAKTGLVCLYAATIMFIAHYIFSRKKWLQGLALIAFMIFAPVIAYVSMPSFRNRLQYVQYDFSNYSKGNFIPGLSDGARVLSLKAGWAITNQHPYTGTGFGDMKPAISKWHLQHYANTFEYERFLPLNEWLLYGAGSGWPGILFFTLGLIVLMRPVWKQGLTGRTGIVVLLIPLITDDTLESQFGVVIFIFVLMWLWLQKKVN